MRRSFKLTSLTASLRRGPDWPELGLVFVVIVEPFSGRFARAPTMGPTTVITYVIASDGGRLNTKIIFRICMKLSPGGESQGSSNRRISV